MSTLQVREPATELEERLVTDDIVIVGEARELSEDVKRSLGYSGVVAFNYTVQKAVFANSKDPTDLHQRHLSVIGHFNPDLRPDTYFVTGVTSRLQWQFEKQYGDSLIGIIIKNMEPTYVPFEVPIQLPKQDINLDICAGVDTAQVSGHTFYKA
ncbi:MAG: hypothetical protein ACYSTS_14500 [Planctomycetota bacterium]